MQLFEIINEYMNICSCNAAELASRSNISPSSISRMRTKQSYPIRLEQAEKLSRAFCEMNHSLEYNSVLERLISTNKQHSYHFDSFCKNFNTLIERLNINAASLARYIQYDPSFISRIRTGKRKPTDILDLTEKIENYVVTHFSRSEYAALVGDEITIQQWLIGSTVRSRNKSEDFIKKIDRFQLSQYLKAIHFDDITAQKLPSNIPGSKKYFGLEEMKRAELDFIQATVLSKSKEDVFLYNEMPIAEMAKDVEFDKKWMSGLAQMINQGIHINIIHHLDRPWKELMLGLEAWIPIYMTGLVHPYYIKDWHKGLFSHINYCSSVCALSGECVEEEQEDGIYYFTRNKTEVEHFNRITSHIFSRAAPLMEIFTEDERAEQLLQDENCFEVTAANETFSNIKMSICPNQWALVSKERDPHIHFVIRHPTLVHAIMNFSPDIIE